MRSRNGLAILAETPLPGTLPLFATGLGALGLIGWRRKRRKNASGDVPLMASASCHRESQTSQSDVPADHRVQFEELRDHRRKKLVMFRGPGRVEFNRAAFPQPQRDSAENYVRPWWTSSIKRSSKRAPCSGLPSPTSPFEEVASKIRHARLSCNCPHKPQHHYDSYKFNFHCLSVSYTEQNGCADGEHNIKPW